MSKRKRNIGLEIRDGLRELKRGDYGRQFRGVRVLLRAWSPPNMTWTHLGFLLSRSILDHNWHEAGAIHLMPSNVRDQRRRAVGAPLAEHNLWRLLAVPAIGVPTRDDRCIA